MNYLCRSTPYEPLDEPLPKRRRATRKCLACARPFRSFHAGNRICPACKTSEEEEWGSAWLREDFSIGRPDQAPEVD